MDHIIDFIIESLVTLFAYVRAVLKQFLEETIFSARPELASSYGDVLILLVSLTSLYIVLSFTRFFKKLIGALVAIGWSLFFIGLAISWT